MTFVALPTKNPGDVLTSALWNTYLQGNADSGFVRKLADTTLVGAAASFDFTSIPQTFAHLRLEVYARSDRAANNSDAIGLRINGDSTAAYDGEALVAVAASASCAEAFSNTYTSVGDMPAATAGANLFAVSLIDILHYADAANNKAVIATSFMKVGLATTNVSVKLSGGGFRSNTNVTRITLISGNGANFVAGSRATLYGMPA